MVDRRIGSCSVFDRQVARPRPCRAALGDVTLLEVDAHEDAPGGGYTDLDEAGCGENAGGADVLELAEVWIALQRAGAALPGEVDGGAGECSADTAASKAGPGDKAGHRPHAVIGLVFGSTGPGDGTVAQQARVGRSRVDRAPADRFTVEVSDQAGRVVDSGCPQAVCSRSREASPSAPTVPQPSLGRILYRWHQHGRMNRVRRRWLASLPRSPRSRGRS